MSSDTQIFMNDLTAGGTLLSSVFRINLNYLPSSVFSFVRKEIKELTPCSVINIFVQRFIITINHSKVQDNAS